MKDLEETFTLYSQLSDVPQAVSLADLQCAQQWIQAAEECEHDTTVLAYQTFLHFSTQHLATLFSLPHDLALLKKLTASTTVDAFSACLRRGKYLNAVELLEQGCVFWSQLFRLRSPLDEVIASGGAGKELADEFTRLTSVLRAVLDIPPNVEPRHDPACHLNARLQDVVNDIRKLPGLSRFLQRPLFSDLQVAAAGGPVIIVNASQYGCDALIVLSDHDPIHVALPITKSRASELALKLRSLTSRAKSRDVTRDIFMLLRELWDAVVFPIVNVLQEFHPHGSRIWWCPTAELSLLPFHAAGAYKEDQPNLSDLYISSYTPTLTALIRSRQERPSDPSIEQPRFLLIRNAQPPAQTELLSVDAELSIISQRIGSVATVTCIQGDDASVSKVAAELHKSEFIHLACHGIIDRNHPFKSGFALGDGLLKVEDIVQQGL